MSSASGSESAAVEGAARLQAKLLDPAIRGERESSRARLVLQVFSSCHKRGVSRCFSNQSQTDGERSALCGDLRRAEGVGDPAEHRLLVGKSGDVHPLVRPTRGVEGERLDSGNAAVLHRHAHGAFRTGLARAAALHVAGKNHPRIARDNLRRVDVAERPVIVAEAREIGDGAGRIGIVPARAVETGVQDADVQPTLALRGVARQEIVRGAALGKTAAVHGDAQFLDQMCMSLPRVKYMHARRIGKRARNHAFGVVIASDDERRQARPMQLAQFAHEKQPGRNVAPVAVEHVAGDDEEFRAAVDRLSDQALDRFAAGRSEGRGNGRVLGPERGEWAVDMQIGGVYELKSHGQTIGDATPGGNQTSPPSTARCRPAPVGIAAVA